MRLAPGSRLGPYEVVAQIGAGGMGEVYRARDTKLGRDVAIKILPESFAHNTERRARFDREARTLASLNHPNIGQIHGLEESDGITALVLELVEGPTLADRVAQGPILLDEALPIARQIADALEAAHERNIIHRDLKPANVKVRADGVVKVLDFGLAKAPEPVAAGGAEVAAAPTITSPAMMTGIGVILGTAAYMSPEQARGQAVDKRTDVWAFGCVLFEMLTGRRAFEGNTVTDTLVRVLEREPEWTALPAPTPEAVRRALRRCLEKNPRRRVRDIGDARLELDEAPLTPSLPDAPRATRWWVLGLAALLLVALGAAIDRIVRRPDPAPGVPQQRRLSDLVGLEETPALSPDGRSVAFTAGVNGKRQLFVQHLTGGGEPLQITVDDADHLFPRWTPDSTSLVYFSPATPGDRQGTLFVIPALRGEARRVASSMGAADVRARDGRLTYFRLLEGKIELVTAPPDASSVDVVARFDPTSGFHRYPRWSPDGDRIAYQVGQMLNQEIYVVPAGGGPPAQLTRGAGVLNGFAWLPDGSGLLCSASRGDTMLYLPTSRLWHVALDGTMRMMTMGEVSYWNPDIARSGSVVAASVRLESDIWSFPTDASPRDNLRNAIRITNQNSHVVTPTAGPGDREVAFVSDRGGHSNIWVIDVASGKLRQITDERDPNVAIGVPVWSPTGADIVFVSTRAAVRAGTEGQPEVRDAPSGPLGLWLVKPDGSNLRSLVHPGVSPYWARDGRSVYYNQTVSKGLLRIDVNGGTPQTVRTDPLRNLIGSDGRTLYMLLERTRVDGLPLLEIRVASPEDGPTRVLAELSQSRITPQLVQPTLSPDGERIALALADGFSTNIWTLSTSKGELRQITDFGGRPTFIVRRVSWSSDGRSVLAAVAEGDADIVLLDGLLGTGRN